MPNPTAECKYCGATLPTDEVELSEVVRCPSCGRLNVPSFWCNSEQLEMLRRSSRAKDMTEWNQWRRVNPEEEIWLQGADLKNAQLKGAALSEAHLEGARLLQAHLEDADLRFASLKGAHFGFASLEEVRLHKAHLERAWLCEAHLEGAFLYDAHLEGAALNFAHLEGADLRAAHFEGASLLGAHLEGADLRFAIVNGETCFVECFIDRDTDFTGVGLGDCRLPPGLKQTLEYNIRRKRWREWHRRQGWWRHLYKWFVWLFWKASDYGRSTGRVISSFFILSLFFAAVYFFYGLLCPPGLVDGLFSYESGGAVQPIDSRWLVAWRSLYFSVVTMTTLGFGDIAAQPLSWWGHGLLMLQVILGYVLLGALVCRLAVVFQSDGPAAKFSKSPKPERDSPQEQDQEPVGDA